MTFSPRAFATMNSPGVGFTGHRFIETLSRGRLSTVATMWRIRFFGTRKSGTLLFGEMLATPSAAAAWVSTSFGSGFAGSPSFATGAWVIGCWMPASSVGAAAGAGAAGAVAVAAGGGGGAGDCWLRHHQ